MEWIAALHGKAVGLDIRTPDAIQLATAIHNGASFFLTNDARLPCLPGLNMLVLDELKSIKQS